jgi:hypothetical protein
MHDDKSPMIRSVLQTMGDAARISKQCPGHLTQPGSKARPIVTIARKRLDLRFRIWLRPKAALRTLECSPLVRLMLGC